MTAAYLLFLILACPFVVAGCKEKEADVWNTPPEDRHRRAVIMFSSGTTSEAFLALQRGMTLTQGDVDGINEAVRGLVDSRDRCHEELRKERGQ